MSATVLSMWLIYQVWGDLTEQNTTQWKKTKLRKKYLHISIKGRGKKHNNLCTGFAWQLQLSQTQQDELFHIPSLPRDVVDLTSRDPFLMSLCLQVWVSVKKMILHNDTKFCLRCMLKEPKLRKAWQQLSDTDLSERWEMIKASFKALALSHCPKPSQVLRQNMPKCLCRSKLWRENLLSHTVTQLQLWTQLVQHTRAHTSNHCHQVGHSRAHASKGGSESQLP